MRKKILHTREWYNKIKIVQKGDSPSTSVVPRESNPFREFSPKTNFACHFQPAPATHLLCDPRKKVTLTWNQIHAPVVVTLPDHKYSPLIIIIYLDMVYLLSRNEALSDFGQPFHHFDFSLFDVLLF